MSCFRLDGSIWNLEVLIPPECKLSIAAGFGFNGGFAETIRGSKRFAAPLPVERTGACADPDAASDPETPRLGGLYGATADPVSHALFDSR